MAEGLDVYGRYNNVTSWAQVNGAKDFVWIKVSDGTTLKNSLGVNYDYGYVGPARATGLPAGGYHYAQFGDPVQQANLFIDRCEALSATDISPMLDLEAPFTANQTAIDFAIAFCNRVLQRGHKPTLYANNSMMLTIRNPFKNAVPDSYITVARYGANPTVTWDNWQFTSTGSCPGVVGNVDLDTGIFPANKGQDMEADERTALLYCAAVLGRQPDSSLGGSNGTYDVAENVRRLIRTDIGNRLTGLSTALTNVTNIVVANEANDLTPEALAAALKPAILPDLTSSLVTSLTNAVNALDLTDVNITPEQIEQLAAASATATADELAGRLAGTPAP